MSRIRLWLLLAAALTGVARAGDEAEGDGALRRLAAMRFVAGVSVQEVTDVLAPAIKELEVADAALVQELEKTEKPEARTGLRVRRCRLAFVRGELERRAAEAMPVGAAEREGHLAAAVEVFKALRLEYRDLPIGGLGYIGESRARRAAGQPAEAIAVLEHLLNAKTPQEKAAVSEPIRVLAVVERLEAMLLTDPAGARREAEAAMRTPEFKKNTPATGQAAWVAARAAVGMDDGIDWVPTLASEPVIAAASPFERMGLLAQLEKISGEDVLTANQRLEWAGLLGASRRPAEALAEYRRAERQDGESFFSHHWSAYGRLLFERGEHAAAGDRFERALDLLGPEGAERVEMITLRARARYAAVDGASVGDRPAAAESARQALLEVVASEGDEEARRAALRRWSLLAEGLEPQAVILTLHRHESLVAGDAALRFARVRQESRHLDSCIRDGSAGAGEAGREARRLTDELDAITNGAGGELRARSALLGAAIRSAPPLEDKQAALQALDNNWEPLMSDAGTARHAADLRLRLLLELGLTDAARAMLADGSPDVKFSPTHRVRLAEALAERYKPGEGGTDLRRDVVSLATTALAQSAGDGGDYEALARRAAEAMIRVEAFSDAQRLIEKFPIALNEGSEEEAVLLEAAALRGRGDTDGAIARLQAAADRQPDSPNIRKALGDIRVSLRQHALALGDYRAARKLYSPGSEAWWETTLSLVTSLDETGEAKDARDVLRVAAAVYPPPGKPTLQSRIEAARESLDAPDGKP